MFNINDILGGANAISDLVGTKSRQVRQMKFFRYKDGKLGIACFDNQTIHGEYWIENLPVPSEYESIFKSSGFNLNVKYDVFLLGLQPFSADKKVLKTPTVQKRLLKVIFESLSV